MVMIKKHDNVGLNDFLMDSYLSFATKGLLSLVYTMADSSINIKELYRYSFDDKSDVLAEAREAEAAGYIDIAFGKEKAN